MSNRLDAMIGREYQDRDGNTKTAWTRIGTAWPTKNGGYRVQLDALPAPRMGQNGQVDTSFVLMPPRDDRQQQSPSRPQQGAPARQNGPAFGDDDNIPF